MSYFYNNNDDMAKMWINSVNQYIATCKKMYDNYIELEQIYFQTVRIMFDLWTAKTKSMSHDFAHFG